MELAELIRVTTTSASAQKKGQWLRLDAQLFSRQLEKNTTIAHSIRAAGMEALLTGISGEGVWRRTPLSWHATAPQSSPSLCCTMKVYHLLCYCALLLCHTFETKCCSLPMCSLAVLLGVRCVGLRVSVSPQAPWCGRSCRALCWMSPSHRVPPALPCLQLGRPCYRFYVLQSL